MDPCRQAQLIQNRSKKSSKVKVSGDLNVFTLSYEEDDSAEDALGSCDFDGNGDDDDDEAYSNVDEKDDVGMDLAAFVGSDGKMDGDSDVDEVSDDWS